MSLRGGVCQSEKENSQEYPSFLKPFMPGKGNFVAFVSNMDSRPLTKESVKIFREVSAIPAEGMTAPPRLVSGIDYSDHRPFYFYDIPAVMITDTASFRNDHYHKKSDTVDTIDFNKMAEVVDGLYLMFIRQLKEL